MVAPDQEHTGMDPTFYRTPGEAAAAPVEKLAYLAAFNRSSEDRPDALVVVDVDSSSPTYATVVGWLDMPTSGDELHHFGWNACSSALCHAGHDPSHLERRYLLIPGLRSSRIHVVDTQPDPRSPKLVRTIEGEVLAERGWLLEASHPSLRTVGPLPERSRRNRGRRPGRDRPARPRHLRAVRAMGGRSRTPVSGIRLLVASQPQRHGDE